MKKFQGLLICLSLIITMLLATTLVGCADSVVEFTIILSVDGENVEIIEINENSSLEDILLENVPSKEGFIFDKWCTDIELTSDFDSSVTISADVTLYAKWAELVSIVFDSNDGSVIDDMEIEINHTVLEMPANPTKVGFVLDEWCTDIELTSVFDISAPITADITLYARWLISNIVTFDSDGGSLLPSLAVGHGLLLDEPSPPVKELHAFVCWRLEEELWQFDVDTVDNDITLVAEWSTVIVIDQIEYEYLGADDDRGFYVVNTASDLPELIIPNTINHNSISYPVIGIVNDAFKNSSILTSVVIGDNVKSIGDGAFEGCRNLTSAVIGDSVTSIGEYSFAGCRTLPLIRIPLSVKSISYNSFDLCFDLIFYVEATSSSRGWLSGWDSFCPIVWDCNNNDTDLDGYAYSLLDGVRYKLIDNFAIVSLVSRSLTQVIIPDSIDYNNERYNVTRIGEYAFANCTSLERVVIANTVTHIGVNAFSECSSLTEILIPENVEIIEFGAFSGCSGLGSIVIPDNVTTMGGYVFSNCSNIVVYAEAVREPSGWRRSTMDDEGYWSDDNWYNTWSGNVAVIWDCNNNNKDIVEYEYYEIDDVTYKMRNSVASVFSVSNSLTDVVIPAMFTHDGVIYEVEEIANYAFYGNTTATSVVIPDGVTKIGDEAFYMCSSLTSIIIPDSVRIMNDYVFYLSDSLIIYAAAVDEPWSWNEYWNASDITVHWGGTWIVNDDGVAQVIAS